MAFGLGLGGALVSSDSKSIADYSFGGGAGGFDLWIGGTPTPGLAMGGALSGLGLSASKRSVDGHRVGVGLLSGPQFGCQVTQHAAVEARAGGQFGHHGIPQLAKPHPVGLHHRRQRHPVTGALQATVHLAAGVAPENLTASPGSVWGGEHHGNAVDRIDTATNTVANVIPTGQSFGNSGGPQAMLFAASSIWSGTPNENAVVRVDPESHKIVATIPVGPGVCGPLAGDDAAVELASIGEVHKLFLGQQGIIAFLDNIQFQFFEMDQSMLMEALAEMKEEAGE